MSALGKGSHTFFASRLIGEMNKTDREGDGDASCRGKRKSIVNTKLFKENKAKVTAQATKAKKAKVSAIKATSAARAA